MPLDLKQSNVSLDPKFEPMLSNLQANILKGHGRNFAFHIFFSFKESKIEATKKWIIDFADQKIKTAKQQLIENKERKASGKDGGIVFTLSLSAHGYDALDLEKPTVSHSFLNGMRADSDKLLDDTDRWTAGFNDESRPIDMMVLVADDDLDTAKKSAQTIIDEVGVFAHFLLSQQGKVLKKDDAIGGGIEHFGYADGISQPLYLADELAKQTTNHWDDKTNLDRILVKDGPSDVDSFGSYLVFRKLEQNVKEFKDAEGDNAPEDALVTQVIDENKVPSLALAGAMLVGRHEDGTPTEKSSLEGLTPAIANDFNYTGDISKCPFHAHIRIMNPRDGDTIAGDVRAQRITRRGMPFDDKGRFEPEVIDITDDMLKENQPTGGVGLLFMCYQSNIDSQFLILQEFWANAGNIKGHDLKVEDSIIGQQKVTSRKRLPIEYGKPDLNEKDFEFPKFVTNRGGEYLFTPSIAFLKSI